MHVIPGHTFKKTVVRQNADVLRKIRVINAARLEVQHFRRCQCGQPDWSGRADNDFSESLALNVIEHAQDWREAKFLQLILRQLEFADRFEIFDRNVDDVNLATRSDDSEIGARVLRCCRHFANGSGDAIHVLEGVGKPGAFGIAQILRNGAGHFLKSFPQPFT